MHRHVCGRTHRTVVALMAQGMTLDEAAHYLAARLDVRPSCVLARYFRYARHLRQRVAA